VKIADDPAPGKRFLTTMESSEYLRRAYGFEVKPWTLLRWAKAGQLPSHRRKDTPGARYRFTREQLDKLMAGMNVTPLE
jgi:predicted site-specific integrase-resolvase